MVDSRDSVAAEVPGMTLEQMAKELYDDCQTVKPDWYQLGAVTRSVWLERAADGVTPEGWQPLRMR